MKEKGRSEDKGEAQKMTFTKLFEPSPFRVGYDHTRLLSEVKHVRAWLVLPVRWGTTLESQVLYSSTVLPHNISSLTQKLTMFGTSRRSLSFQNISSSS
jgi:hypothetical protein